MSVARIPIQFTTLFIAHNQFLATLETMNPMELNAPLYAVYSTLFYLQQVAAALDVI